MRDFNQIPLAILALAVLPSLLGAAAPPLLSEEVSGHGQSEVDARQEALGKVRERIVALLKDYQPGLRWEPSVSYLLDTRLARDLVHVPDAPSKLLGPHHCVTVRIEVTEQDVRKMLQQDRLQQRHFLAAKLLAGFVALLSLLAVFFRLEDVTRGYYTMPLRIGLALCAVLIGVGVWFVW